jgi:hypothetical protein
MRALAFRPPGALHAASRAAASRRTATAAAPPAPLAARQQQRATGGAGGAAPAPARTPRAPARPPLHTRALPWGAPPSPPLAPPSADERPAPCRSTASPFPPSPAPQGGGGVVPSPSGGPVTRTKLRELHALHAAPAGFERLCVKGDGACMFRSVVQGAALLKTGSLLGSDQEWAAAQRLRADVVEHLRASRE